MSLPELSREEILRYSRHLLIPEVGLEGQRKLKAASILIIGTGGLGSPVALYLAAAGVGTLGLCDGDVVDRSNLQRQIIHTTARTGQPKVESARQAAFAVTRREIRHDEAAGLVCPHHAAALLLGPDAGRVQSPGLKPDCKPAWNPVRSRTSDE